jgi:hypothetical protein
MEMRVPILLASAAAFAMTAIGAQAQSSMTLQPLPYSNPDNAKDTSSKAKRDADKERRKKAEEAKKAHKVEKPDEGKKTPDANSPG